MNYLRTNFTKFVKLLLDVFFIATIAFVLILPKIIPILTDLKFINIPTNQNNIFMFILFCSDITICFVLYELRKIFKSIINSDPFNQGNVNSLFRMGAASFLLAIFFVFKILIINTILTYIVILILIVGGCFSFVLSELFREALRVKIENDLTI